MNLTNNIFVIISLIGIIGCNIHYLDKFKKEFLLFISLLIIYLFDINALFIGLLLTFIIYKLSENINFYKFITSLILICISFIYYKSTYTNDFNLLGFSFYSLKLIHYSFERYKGTIDNQDLIILTLYCLFFPTLLAGPINRIELFINNLNNPIKYNFEQTLTRILKGYFKIVILSSIILINIKIIYIDNLECSFLKTYFLEVYYWINLYLQFSGYMDIIIGVSMFMGFEIIENFNKPYLSKNLLEFWSRWHISLGKFIKTYVFYPFVMQTRNYKLAILFSILIFAMWHDISIYYLLWGFFQSMGIIINHIYISKNYCFKIPITISIFLTLNYVILASILSDFLAKFINGVNL